MPRKPNDIIYEGGTVVGNIENKETVKNPISRMLVAGFDKRLFEFLHGSRPASIHEVGCGEGRLTLAMARQFAVPIRATDFSAAVIKCRHKEPPGNVDFVKKNIYELKTDDDRADVMVCCEVLEHLDNPERAIDVLRRLNARCYIFSVPREPLWRVLNLVRGKYVRNMGNTPGHLNHWSKKGFLRLLSRGGFKPERIACPLPWIMVSGSFGSF